MINDWLLNDLFILASLIFAAILIWRVRKLEKHNKELEESVIAASNLIFELSKISASYQKTTMEQSKTLISLIKYSETTYNEFASFREDVGKFVAFVSEQIQFLSLANKNQKTSSSSILPVKKNDKTKPN